ncbi:MULTISPECIES: N-acetylmuramoyl-L-alanine amidase [Bacillus]|uniref:N-acetylmuramoyl-L-alanine amidase n=1 Tax=Bacillus TaxID=1386 RepID=UPI000B45514E|nr:MULTISPECIES: N-acetylmuramoyl-L-alanine amidase [Bacillus]MBH0347278.1 amidase [Bacillus thuringiensis]MDA1906403.1 N-acetylmuramoyl-L-alanine amidase [Bacillus cereus]MDA2168527.1 N-acetylmuramoyl-L-alanine amidase [Bacillus cereus]MED1299182.1 N-acetylmuramoyl-L-alanine amidase [Bacillus pacificus]NRR16481.1 N-acetylmuramoyl-L-alanine amidase [Bacillus pacificus]
MKYRAVAAGILAASLLSSPVSSFAAAKKFSDVPSWAQESVDYLVGKKALDGKPDGTFSPSEAVDKGSAAKILAVVLGLPIDPKAKPSFKDAQNHWAAPYIAAVEKAGVISGDGTGKFNPSSQINRASMASMLVQAYSLDKKIIGELPTQFKDLEPHWGKKQANILVALEISKGTGNGWEPEGTVTRAEAAQFIAMADQNKTDTSKRMYMNRNFITYHQPSLSSGITDVQHKPQMVVVKEQRADGWLKIVTSKGEKWTPLTEKTETINEGFTTYEAASHSSKVLGTYNAQTVTVMEESGSWIRIRVGAGFQWVDKNQLNPVKQENFLEGKAIIIDPGHGGIDSGNVGYYEKESETVLDVSLRLKKIFEQKAPFTVMFTRTDNTRPGVDSTDSLKKRVEFAQEHNGDIFVSIHANGSQYKNGQGTETLYYQSARAKVTNPHVEDSKLLAQKIQDRLVAALGTKDRGIKHQDLYVTRENTMPAVLTELAFVDNKSDADKIATPKQRQAAAEAIYQGILDYYEAKGNSVSSFR